MGRILFIESFTSSPGVIDSPSSDSIGYGVTASQAIRRELKAIGHDVMCSSDYMPRLISQSAALTRSQWIIDTYSAVLDYLSHNTAPDLIFCFHAFQAFPAEIRRILLDLDLRIPLIGYTHGSHWDPTDLFRQDHYPGLEFTDLSNLCAMDRILVTSHYMKETLRVNIAAVNADLAQSIDNKVRIVGLPIDVLAIERNKANHGCPRPNIIFNHAPIPAKDPMLFIDAIAEVLRSRDVEIRFTRKLLKDSPLGLRARALSIRYPGKFHFGEDLSINDYYRWLWMSDIQVSTALHESLGIATLEAMYTRTCCILPRVGSYPELCEGDQQTLYDRSTTELIDRLHLLIDDGDLRHQLGERMRQFSLRYTPERVTRSIQLVIDELLSGT